MENLPKKKSIDDFRKNEDRASKFHAGLLKDAGNVWQHIYGAVADLSDPVELKYQTEKASTVVKDSLKRLNTKLLTYREYLEHGYMPDAVEAILHHPESDPEKIKQFDARVAEYNELIGREKFLPQQALDIYNRAMALFEE